MGKVANRIISFPATVKVSLNPEQTVLNIAGPCGKMHVDINPCVEISLQEQQILTKTNKINQKFAVDMVGTQNSLIQNAIQGVLKPFEKNILIDGVGYKAVLTNQQLQLSLGFSHPLTMPTKPQDLQVTCPKPTIINIKGCDKQKVGEYAAQLKRFRPAEPYHMKGLRYEHEIIRRKEGKTASTGTSNAPAPKK